MDNNKESSGFDILKEPPMIAAITAIIALGTSVVYFQGKITALEEELEKVKTHLKATINYVENVQKESIKKIHSDIKMCDNNLAQLGEELRSMNKKQTSYEHSTFKEHRNHSSLPNYSYTRITKPSRETLRTDRTETWENQDMNFERELRPPSYLEDLAIMENEAND